MSNPKTLKHFLDKYVFSEDDNHDIADDILHICISANFAREAAHKATGKSTPSIAYSNRATGVTSDFKDGFLKLLEEHKNSARKDLYLALSKQATFISKIIDSDKQSVAIIAPIDILIYWASITLTALEGQDDFLTDEMWEDFEIIKEDRQKFEEAAKGKGTYTATLNGKFAKASVKFDSNVTNFGKIDSPVRAVTVLSAKLRKEIESEISGDKDNGGSWADRNDPPQDKALRGML